MCHGQVLLFNFHMVGVMEQPSAGGRSAQSDPAGPELVYAAYFRRGDETPVGG